MSDHALPTSPSASPAWRALLARAVAFVRTERGVATLALAAVGLHVVDDNYLQPAPGTSAADHLASGLVPLALLAAAAALYPRLRAGARAATAFTFGAMGASTGFPGAYHLLDGSTSGDHYTGILALAGGIALIAAAPIVLWRSRRTGGSPPRPYPPRAGTAATGPLAAPPVVL